MADPTVEQRLAVLEAASRRRSRVSAAALVVGLALFLGAAADDEPPGVMRVGELELVGRDGKVAGHLRVDPSGAGVLELFGPNGRWVTLLSANAGGRLVLRPGDEPVIELSAGEAPEAAHLLLRTRQGTPAVHLTSDRQGRGYVGVLSADGIEKSLRPAPSDFLGVVELDAWP